jgi:hypothetical protein
METLNKTDTELYLQMTMRLKSRLLYDGGILEDKIGVPDSFDIRFGNVRLTKTDLKKLMQAYLKENARRRFTL